MAQLTSDFVIDVDQADFESKVLGPSHDRPVVVDFWAEWCGPCRMLGPVLERLIRERDGEILLAKIDIDRNQELALQYRIEAIPAVKAFRDGKPILEFVGVLPEPELRAFLDRLVPSQTDLIARQAAELEKTDPVKAEKLYRQASDADRGHIKAALGLTRLLIARGNDTEAEKIL